MSDEIDDDTFKYEGSEISQCISGFGRNAIEVVDRSFVFGGEGDEESNQARADNVKWHIEELVRWCRYFNGKCKLLENQLKEMGK